MKKIIDLGCGPNKVKGAIGVDHFKYPGVDIVCDFNKFPWPIGDDQFDIIWANDVVEHINSIPAFLAEVHRIGKNGAFIHIKTPHFSSYNSWEDPTHIKHLGVNWHSVITDKSTYLSSRVPSFELVSSRIIFRKPMTISNMLTRFLIKICGLKTWEKKWCFIFRGENIFTVLKVIK